jgi:hypothetical protein
MFSENLFRALKPLLQSDYSEQDIQELASYISESIEINPREGSNVSFLRDSILNYVNSEIVQQKHAEILKSRLDSASKLQDISTSIQQLSTISTASLKSTLQASVTDQTLAKQIYNLNFGYKQNLGEIIYATRHNQGGRLGY